MKEATGELNMTVITVVAIAAVGAFFYAFIWPNIKSSISGQSVCSNGAGYTNGKSGDADYVSCGSADKNGAYTCTYATESDGKITTKTANCRPKSTSTK